MPAESMGLRVQRYKKIFRKMSMPKDIFSAGLRQPAYLWRFQQVKEHFWRFFRTQIGKIEPHRQLFIRNYR